MLNYASKLLYGDETTHMPSISSKDVIKKVEVKPQLTLYDLFQLPENKGKSLVLKDLAGQWIMQMDQMCKLTREHKEQHLPPLESYTYCWKYGICIFYLTNGHTFIVKYLHDSENISLEDIRQPWQAIFYYDIEWR